MTKSNNSKENANHKSNQANPNNKAYKANANHKFNQANPNYGSNGNNTANAKMNGNRGAQLNPNRK
jgi:hypothetical protein